MISDLHKAIILECQKSVIFFITNFGTVDHPSAGAINFNLFGYQKHALKAFRENRFVIFKKCRQTGMSTISGAFALWLAMFYSNKRILIVSRTDSDAMSFLKGNVKFMFNNLPPWMRTIWKPVKDNDHEIIFPNGSSVRSLTSHPDVLRSNASSLNIIDEAAFIDNMDVLWASGWPTLIHGGAAIVISTVNGVGNWYWNTWKDAEAGTNVFHPLIIDWWNMDWQIPYRDPLTGANKVISPIAGLRKCETLEEVEKYGPYWSPWLEDQWRGLQERGEDWKFKQEILAEFVGSGNTVIPERTLKYLDMNTDDEFKTVKESRLYSHPVTGERVDVHFSGGEGKELAEGEGLRIWEPPFTGSDPEYENGRLVKAGEPYHRYVIGLDLATGKGKDFHGAEIIDIDEMEQVAELMIRCELRELKFIIDYIGRWYNNAMLVVERNNGGDAFIDDLRHQFMYPMLWRKKTINDKPSARSKTSIKVAEYGFMTTVASKPKLNKAMMDYLRPDSEGLKIRSTRLVKQLYIYVRKKDKVGRDTNKTEAETGTGNHDDLVMALGMALYGLPDAIESSSEGLIPQSMENLNAMSGNVDVAAIIGQKMDKHVLPPFMGMQDITHEQSVQQNIEQFAMQLGAMPISDGGKIITKPKHRL